MGRSKEGGGGEGKEGGREPLVPIRSLGEIDAPAHDRCVGVHHNDSRRGCAVCTHLLSEEGSFQQLTTAIIAHIYYVGLHTREWRRQTFFNVQRLYIEEGLIFPLHKIFLNPTNLFQSFKTQELKTYVFFFYQPLN